MITVDGTSDFVFCYSVQDGDCLQQYLLFNPKNRFFNVTMVYRGGFGEADPPIEIAPSRRVRGMETLSEFLNGQIAR